MGMYKQQQEALANIQAGYAEIRKQQEETKDAEDVQEFKFSGGETNEEGQPEQLDLSKMSVVEKDEVITTLSSAVMDLTGRLDNLEKGGSE